MQPYGEFGLILGLGGLAVDHVLAQLFAANGEVVAPLLEGLIGLDQMGQQFTFLT
jgi:hypothetical protein